MTSFLKTSQTWYCLNGGKHSRFDTLNAFPPFGVGKGKTEILHLYLGTCHTHPRQSLHHIWHNYSKNTWKCQLFDAHFFLNNFRMLYDIFSNCNWSEYHKTFVSIGNILVNCQTESCSLHCNCLRLLPFKNWGASLWPRKIDDPSRCLSLA